MSKYIGYLFATLLKRPSFYIVLSLFVLLMGSIVGLTIYFTNDSTVTPFSFVNSFWAWLAMIFSSAFISIVVVHVFKKQEQEGTELMIAAKPISRSSIVLGKLSVIYSAIFLFQFVSFCLFFFIGFFDKNSSAMEQFKYASSMFIGGLVVTILLASILMLFSAFMGKIGTVLIATMGLVFFFIFSASVVPITGANLKEVYDGGGILVLNTSKQDDKTYIDSSYIYSKAYNLSITQNADSAYRYLKYADIWGQWSYLFQTILKQPNDDSGSSGFYKTAHYNLENPSEDKLTSMPFLRGKNNEQINYIPMSISLKEINGKELTIDITTKAEQYVDSNKAAFEAIADVKAFEDEFGKAIQSIIGSPEDIDDLDMEKYLLSASAGYLIQFVSQKIPNLSYDFLSPSASNSFDITIGNEKYNVGSLEKVDASKYFIVKSIKPFLNDTVVSIVWSLIAVGLLVWATLLYLRRDFK